MCTIWNGKKLYLPNQINHGDNSKFINYLASFVEREIVNLDSKTEKHNILFYTTHE